MGGESMCVGAGMLFSPGRRMYDYGITRDMCLFGSSSLLGGVVHLTPRLAVNLPQFETTRSSSTRRHLPTCKTNEWPREKWHKPATDSVPEFPMSSRMHVLSLASKPAVEALWKQGRENVNPGSDI